MILDFNPRAKSYLALENLFRVGLAYGIFAAGPVVGRDLCKWLANGV